MPTEIKMPKLGESVVEGTISRWLKRPGEHVELYEPLLEVQTDKVDTEVPAPRAGVVRELAVPEGATVKVGTLIAVLDDAEQPAEQLALDAHQVPAGEEDPQPAEHASPQPSRFISPVVARMAQEHSLDLSQIPGTGLGGRVSKKDVERFLANGRTGEDRRPKAEDQGPPTIDDVRLPVEAAISSPTPQSPSSHTQASSLKPQASSIKTQHSALSPEHSPDSDLLPISAMRRAVAEHMERSVRIAPHVTTVFEADLGRVLAHRDRHRAEFERQAARLTLTPYFVQAVVAGLRAVPVINSTWADEGILQHRRIHIGVAVALEEGLIVPVVRDADEKSWLGVARAVADLSERARGRRLQPGETQGGTFTLTNHGVSGSLLATPIISQPQSAILGVGAVQKRVVVISQGGVDSIAIRPMCYLSLTFDHRLIDGATADQFLTAVNGFLEAYPE